MDGFINCFEVGDLVCRIDTPGRCGIVCQFCFQSEMIRVEWPDGRTWNKPDALVKVKETLERALEVINDAEASELARLKAYKVAMESEIALAAPEDSQESFADMAVTSSFEEECKNAEKVIAYYKEALAEADRQYKSLVSQANFLRLQVLKEWYEAMPED